MDKKEILRYLLTRSTVQDEALNSLIDEIIAEAQQSCTPKSIYRIFDCSVSEDALTVCETEFKSRRLAQNLAGCKRVAIMAATLGTPGDMLLRLHSSEGAKLVITQAVLAAYIEEVCDGLQAEIERENNVKTRQRYSPGYFDLDISEQKKLFELVDITKRCGITLTDSFQMIPTKSVTAFAGIE